MYFFVWNSFVQSAEKKMYEAQRQGAFWLSLLLGGLWYWCWCGMSQAIWCFCCRFHFISTKHPNISPSSKRGSKHDRRKSSSTLRRLWSGQGPFQQHADSSSATQTAYAAQFALHLFVFLRRDECFVYYSVGYIMWRVYLRDFIRRILKTLQSCKDYGICRLVALNGPSKQTNKQKQRK